MTKQALKQESHENIVPFRPLSMFEEMEQMFNQLSPVGWGRSLRSHLPFTDENLPKVDVIDRDNNILVRAAVPGVKVEDLEVSTTDHSVTIRGKTRHEEREEKGEFYRCEISSGDFLRTVTLPDRIDEAKAEASFKDGLLELTLPKQENAKRRTIEIKS